MKKLFIIAAVLVFGKVADASSICASSSDAGLNSNTVASSGSTQTNTSGSR